MNNTQETIALPDFQVCLVKPHDDAPTHELVDLGSLINHHQKGLVLYFYPKDNTQGCTTQATDFSALACEFNALGYLVVGVSRDGIKSHQNFIQKHSLKIGLISDGDEALCQHFGVIQPKKLYGKVHLGVVRSTFVFNQTGQMILSLRLVKAKDHAQTLLHHLSSAPL